MPRNARCDIQSEYNHIIVQGINKEHIFMDDNLKQIYIEIIKKNLDNNRIKMLSYCIMSNHAHMLIHSKDIKNISELMSKTNTAFAIRYNKINDRVGYVFRNRYYLQQVLNKKHLYNCIAYIHKNPVKAGIVKNMEDYKFSSYNEYKGNLNLITKDGIGQIFKNPNNYGEIFDVIHENNDIGDVFDIGSKRPVDEVINKYIVDMNKTYEQIKMDKCCLGGLFLRLQKECMLSLREIAKMYGMGKDKVRSMINMIK